MRSSMMNIGVAGASRSCMNRRSMKIAAREGLTFKRTVGLPKTLCDDVRHSMGPLDSPLDTEKDGGLYED